MTVETDNTGMVSREFHELQIAQTRVETLLAVHRDDFMSHADRDEKTFTELFNIQRAIRDDVQSIPKKITSCRDQLEHKIHEDIEKHYVTKAEFDKFSNRITYTLSGIMLVGIFATWLLSIFVDVTKIIGP